MRITRLQGRNVKGQTFAHDLAPVTLLHGKNWAGKTARLDALTLALAGYLPGVASKPNEVFDRVASGNPLDVQAQMDNGVVVNRRWTRNGSGTVSKHDSAADVNNGGAPVEFSMPAVALDPSEFLGLSARERVKFLFGRCKVGPDMTVNAMARALVANVKNIRLETNTEASEAAIAEVSAKLNAGPDKPVEGPQQWLEEMVLQVGEQKKAAVATVQRLEKTMQGLAQTSLDGVAPPQDAERRLIVARKALEEAQADLARTEEAGRSLAAQHKAAKELAATAVDVAETQEHIKRLEEELKGPFSKVPEASPAPVQRLMTQPRPDDAVERLALDQAVKRANELDTAVRLAEAECDRLKHLIEQARHAETCPTCGQSVKALQAVVIAGYQAKLDDAVEAVKKARNASKKFKVTPVAAALEEVRGLQKQWDEESAHLAEEYRQAVAEWHERNARYIGAQHALKVTQQRVAELKEKVAANAKAKEAADRLPALGAELAKSREAYRILVTLVSTRRDEVSQADVAYKRLTAARAEEATRARAAQELERCRAVAEVWKQAQKLVAELQSKLVAAAVGPLVERANELCGGLLRAPLALEDGELMMMNNERKVTWKTFSDGEQLIVFNALKMALASDSPIRLAVMGRFESLDYESKPKFIKTMLSLIKAGKLDQCILVEVAAVEEFQDQYAQFLNDDFSMIEVS